MGDSIEESNMLQRSNVFRSQTNRTAFKTPGTNPGDMAVIDQSKMWTEQERVKNNLTIEDKKYKNYKQHGCATYSIV